ncbi:MAG: DUF2849 domain-containing protein [Aestuariivita sp.]|nr:DUF2849 domain-containing protein [Aestuariivita sp.]MCY4201964.1 DUF2849 domain-containing protein [Aestuariivita sp.]MCY4288227.1 DUF2849 domain-containing protein [Aestuariivita sp.]MCY4346210.1 DUF2849 domain-containing protein [Aestuariivita sp.]
MLSRFSPKVITAHNRADGEIIFLAEDDTWVSDIDDAEVLTDEADAQLRLLYAEQQERTVTRASLAEVSITFSKITLDEPRAQSG